MTIPRLECVTTLRQGSGSIPITNCTADGGRGRAGVRRLLDEIAPGSYRLDMVTYAIGGPVPSMGKLLRELREWLSALNRAAGYHAAAAAYRAVSHLKCRPRRLARAIRCAPVLPGHTARHLVGTHTTAGWSDDAGRITAAFESRRTGTARWMPRWSSRS
jgi:hypothetical protein